MPTPTIPAGNLFMNATLYTGNSGTQTVTNGAPGASFQPDFVWIKDRSVTSQYVLTDSVRGVTKQLFSSLTNAEQTSATAITSFNSNGFTTGANPSPTGATNSSPDAFVGWQWKAGGAAVTNTAGTISSQVSANTTSGFSIVTYTGTGANATVGHGLGVAPSMVIVKCRSVADWWPVYHSSLGATKNLRLNDITAVETLSNIWNDTAPTSSVFSIGTSTETGASSRTYVAYCFAQIAGYSAFGSYTGNNSTDGPFVYLGFRPRFVMIKSTVEVSNWFIWDTSRSTYNAEILILMPSISDAEFSDATYAIDALSNGFKIRGLGQYAGYNNSGNAYIYMAFAENPFKYANAR
jgi:hypothetical protein